MVLKSNLCCRSHGSSLLLAVPFLAPGVGRIGRIELDNYPMVHMKDVLSHEVRNILFLPKLLNGSDSGLTVLFLRRLIDILILSSWG